MKLNKNRFVIFYVFNIILLIVILLLAIPASKYLSKINLNDNEFATNQSIINPGAKSPGVIDRFVEISFKASVDEMLQWDFSPLEDSINLKLGDTIVVKYEGKNLSNKTITSTANFIASPESVYPYLIKTECFCFQEQTLSPGESKIFTMVFFLDPSLDSDDNLSNLKELVFTYEFSEYKS